MRYYGIKRIKGYGIDIMKKMSRVFCLLFKDFIEKFKWEEIFSL